MPGPPRSGKVTTAANGHVTIRYQDGNDSAAKHHDAAAIAGCITYVISWIGLDLSDVRAVFLTCTPCPTAFTMSVRHCPTDR